MEELKPAQTPPTHSSPGTGQTLPPYPNNKKRPLDYNDGQIRNTRYFKMRAVLRDLRPHFIEVVRTPDFRNCNAAHEIQDQVKVMMDLYKQMVGEKQDGQKPREQNQDGKPMEQPLPDRAFAKASEEAEKQQQEKQPIGDDVRRTYVVGGSAFGWNFVTYPGSKAVYYGVTKETFRSAK